MQNLTYSELVQSMRFRQFIGRNESYYKAQSLKLIREARSSFVLVTDANVRSHILDAAMCTGTPFYSKARSWNWYAFFLHVFWAAFRIRKYRVIALGYLLFTALFLTAGSYSILILLAMQVFVSLHFGIFGNALLIVSFADQYRKAVLSANPASAPYIAPLQL